MWCYWRLESVAEDSTRKEVETPGMRIWKKALERTRRTLPTKLDEVFRIGSGQRVVVREAEVRVGRWR